MSKNYIPLALAVFAGSLVFAAAALSTNLGRTYDQVVEIRTAPVSHYFHYNNSILRPAVLAKVSSHSVGSNQESQYEDLWYHEWDCIGSHRYSALKVNPGQQIALRVEQQEEASPLEQQAAANAVVRLLLDSYANGSMVTIVLVPEESLQGISEAMRRASFEPCREATPDEPVYAVMQLQLQTPSGAKQTLYYGRRAK